MATLTTLPLELIAHIVSILHARNPRTGNEYVLNVERKEPPNRRAVSRLSKTCRRLRDVGQAELFTSIKCEGRLPQAIQLIRTLIKRPELGAAVREISLSDLEGESKPQWQRRGVTGWAVTEDDAAVLNEALRRFDVCARTDEAGETAWDGHPLTFQAVSKAKASGYLSFEHGALAALAILYSPNVARIALHAHVWTLPHFVTPTGTFDSLAEITWEPGPHGESMVLDDSMGWLFSAAPNLKRFHAFILSGVDGGCTHKGVEEVVVAYSSLDSSCFSTIFKMFPNMTEFTYTADTPPMWSSYDEATPSEMAEALLQLKDTLTSLTLDWEQSPAAQEREWGRDEISLSALSQMNALQYLSITASDVARNDSDSETESEDDDEDEDENDQGKEDNATAVKPVKESRHAKFLRSILGPNVETLDLADIPQHFSMLSFADVAATSFPKLKTIRISHYDEYLTADVAVVRAYFKERGIAIV